MVKCSSQRFAIPGSDLTISRLRLGGVKLGSVLDEDASLALLGYLVEQGGNFIDTAQIHADWLSGVVPSFCEKR
jgi:aryl-alcohol dehydrogenase-like predicted oxidoreductase